MPRDEKVAVLGSETRNSSGVSTSGWIGEV